VKALATIALGLLVGIASLICLLSSICAVVAGSTVTGRVVFAICSFIFLGVAIGGVMLIGAINRRQ
jgi:hypothetical protein